MAKHVIIALDWLQTNYHYEVVYCYIVHSSLWPNARAHKMWYICWFVAVLLLLLLILHSLTFYFWVCFSHTTRTDFLFVVAFYLLLDYFEKKVKWIVYWLYGICSPHIRNGPLLLLLAGFIFHFFSLVLFTMWIRWSYNVCAHSIVYAIRSYGYSLCLSLSMFKTVFPLCADRDLLLFVSKLFISQIIFLFRRFWRSLCFFFTMCLSFGFAYSVGHLALKPSAKQFQQ